jgi:hypothetical protein
MLPMLYMHVKKEVLCCKFLIFSNCNFVCFRIFLTGFGHLQTSETSGRNMTVEFNRQTDEGTESAEVATSA